jgi:branched-chain amino acid transport system permease protein
MMSKLISMRTAGIVLFAMLLLVPAGANKFQLYIATLILIYIILTLGLNILLGYAGQLAFANAAMFGIGAYGTGLLQKHFDWPFWLSSPIGVLAAVVVGTVLVLPALRLSGIYLALATLAFAQCTIWVMSHWSSVTFGPSGFTLRPIDFSPLPISSEQGVYYLSWICCVLLLILARNIIQSRIGRAFVALRDHEIAAQSLGINLFYYKALAFALSGLYAGVAGALYAGLLSFVGPESFGLQQMALQLAAVVIGGTASISGSVLGGVLIVLLQEFVREFKFSIEIVFGALLVAFVLLKPTGLIDLIRLVNSNWRERLRAGSDSANGGRSLTTQESDHEGSAA